MPNVTCTKMLDDPLSVGGLSVTKALLPFSPRRFVIMIQAASVPPSKESWKISRRIVVRATPPNFVLESLGAGLSNDSSLALRDLRIEDVSEVVKDVEDALVARGVEELLVGAELEVVPEWLI